MYALRPPYRIAEPLYSQRGLKHPSNLIILSVLCLLFLITTSLWALELAQLIGLDELLLSSNLLDANSLFNRFYILVARETKVTGILFEAQASNGTSFVRNMSAYVPF